MTNSERLKKQLVELYSLVHVQQSLRLALRSFWLGMTGILVGWGVNALWGWLPNPLTWILVGLAFALIPILMIWGTLYPVLFALNPKPGWVWRMDRTLGLRQQFSTAWEVAQKKQTGQIDDLLVQDVLGLMPRVRQRALSGGWFRKVDVLSTIAVMLLACFLLISTLLKPVFPTASDQPADTAPQTTNPPAAEPFFTTQVPSDLLQMQPQGAPGAGDQGAGEAAGENSPAPGEQDGQSPGQGADQNTDAPINPNLAETADALRQMGSELSQQAGTYTLGEALQNLDMNGSAEAMQNLADQLKDLSQESRENLAQAMQDAADSMGQGGESPLSQDLADAADALSGEDPGASEALGNVAEDLRQLADEMQNSGSASSGSSPGGNAGTGAPEPLNRLPGEGGELSLPENSDSQSGLLSPALPNGEPGDGTASGSYNSARPQGEDVIQTPLLPGSTLWKWRNVVSEFFQR